MTVTLNISRLHRNPDALLARLRQWPAATQDENKRLKSTITTVANHSSGNTSASDRVVATSHTPVDGRCWLRMPRQEAAGAWTQWSDHPHDLARVGSPKQGGRGGDDLPRFAGSAGRCATTREALLPWARDAAYAS